LEDALVLKFAPKIDSDKLLNELDDFLNE